MIDENNVLIAGHGRLLASKHLQIKEIPAIRLTHLSEAQKKAYRIADNKLTENGDWDTDLLKIEFEEIQNLNLDLNLDITGFDNQEIDLLFNTPAPADAKLNEIPYIPDNEVVSKVGDILQLGNHRIICGDALQETTYAKLLQDKRAAMVFTDPPYNVKIEGHVCGKGTVRHKEFAMASGEMASDEFVNFLTNNFKLFKEFSKDGSLHFICMDWHFILNNL